MATGLSSQRELGRFVPYLTSDSQHCPAARRGAAFWGSGSRDLHPHSRPVGLNSMLLFEKTDRIPGCTV